MYILLGRMYILLGHRSHPSEMQSVERARSRLPSVPNRCGASRSLKKAETNSPTPCHERQQPKPRPSTDTDSNRGYRLARSNRETSAFAAVRCVVCAPMMHTDSTSVSGRRGCEKWTAARRAAGQSCTIVQLNLLLNILEYSQVLG